MAGMLRFSKAVLEIVLIAGLCLWPAAGFCSGTSKKIEKTKSKAGKITREIRKNKKKVKALTREENAALRNLDKAERALDRARKKLSRCRAGLAELEAESEAAHKAHEALTADIRDMEAYAARRMAALYKLNRLGTLHMLASADSLGNFFQRKTALERILGHDRELLAALSEKKTELDGLRKELDAQKEKKLALESDYENQAQDLSRKKDRKNRLLAGIRSQKNLMIASIRSLKASAAELDKKLRSLEILRKKELEARRKRELEARRKKLEAEKKRRKKKENAQTSASPSVGKAPSGKFAKLKGRLRMPVTGKVASSFGRYKNKEFNVVNFRSGIDIRAEKSAPIRAVCAGEVIYSGWFKGYGNMMIIDHGDHYYTVYAHAETLRKKVGDKVGTGEVIATVGDSDSLTGPGLHFEVRHHGKSVDPMKWLVKRNS